MVSSTPSPPRRITRGSLARFAYSDDNTSKGKEVPVAPIPDIEDAAGTTTKITTTTSSRKRKRTTVSSTSNGVSTSPSSPAVKSELLETSTRTTIKPSKPKRAPRKPARKTIDPVTNSVSVAPPSDWEEMYGLVKTMRISGPAANAAVDTMGCERLADPDASPKDQRFHTLVALMLSSQTKDTTNAVAMRRLKTELPAHTEGAPVGLNLDNMLAVDPAKLNELIWAVGFHNNKTKYLKQAAEILRDTWDGDIPDTIEGLTSLPGVGPKMAHLCLSAAWGRTEGIGVDVHVHRITNMWGWHKTKNPEETRMALQSWLPRDRWREINWLLVGFGQSVCLPVGKKCGDCELGLKGLCKAAERAKVIEGRKVRQTKVDIDTESGLVVKKEEEEIQETVVKDMVVKEEVDAPSPTNIKKEEGYEEEKPLSPKRNPAKKRR